MSASPCTVSFSVPLVRDLSWERAPASLPVVLSDALRSAGLDVAGVLAAYPRGTVEELELQLGVRLVTTSTARGALSDATSSGRISSTYGQRLPLQDLEWKTSVVEGGDPGTDQAISVATGGDPITDQEALGETGGDPITDHASFGDLSTCMAATCPPCRSGWLATTTANPVPASPGLLTVSSVGQEVPDGFPRENSEHLDGFPSSSSLTHEHFGGSSLIDRCLIRRFMNLSSDCASVRFSRTFLHDVDESEDLRQSRIEQLQNLPASDSIRAERPSNGCALGGSASEPRHLLESESHSEVVAIPSESILSGHRGWWLFVFFRETFLSCRCLGSSWSTSRF